VHAVRLFARESHIQPAAVSGNGPGGRITLQVAKAATRDPTSAPPV
jgi:pyruvate/2-oxoglutarate dehydrogenase complex dihydrolipoamide acyltransferase (E2) component